MSKTTIYEAQRKRFAEVATEKAKIHGKSTWGFTYRGQEVQVTATEANGKIRTYTTPVKNKGK